MPNLEFAWGDSCNFQFHIDVHVASRGYAVILGESFGRNPFGGHEDAAGKRLVDVVLQNQFEIRPILREFGVVRYLDIEHVTITALIEPRESIIHDLYLRFVVRQRHGAAERIAERNQRGARAGKRACDMVAKQENRLDDKEDSQHIDGSCPEPVLLDVRGGSAVGDIKNGWKIFCRSGGFRGGNLAAGFCAGSLGFGVEFGFDLVDLGFDTVL